MSTSSCSIQQIFEAQHESLQLYWRVARESSSRLIELKHAIDYGSDLVGRLNPVHPERLQVIGLPESMWISNTPHEQVRQLLNHMLQYKTPGLFVVDDLEVHPLIQTACEQTETPLFVTQLSGATVIEKLRRFLARTMAEKTEVHGVFMDVLGMGVLITGDSGVGKSELALELISRGHGLVADDVVELYRMAPGSLDGRCPKMLRDFIEVRGLGLLNIRTIFGEAACRRRMRLRLIVHLQKPAVGHETERLPLDTQTQEILGASVKKVVLPVAEGRNLSVLLEAAVRNTILQLRGIDGMEEFLIRQNKAMQES